MIGQLGTPSDTVRYAATLTDELGQPFSAEVSYTLMVPPEIVQDSGYYSITVCGTDNKLLISNQQKVCDRTS
jgi:hypothetical protein